jgi:hypothetical protein
MLSATKAEAFFVPPRFATSSISAKAWTLRHGKMQSRPWPARPSVRMQMDPIDTASERKSQKLLTKPPGNPAVLSIDDDFYSGIKEDMDTNCIAGVGCIVPDETTEFSNELPVEIPQTELQTAQKVKTRGILLAVAALYGQTTHKLTPHTRHILRDNPEYSARCLSL